MESEKFTKYKAQILSTIEFDSKHRFNDHTNRMTKGMIKTNPSKPKTLKTMIVNGNAIPENFDICGILLSISGIDSVKNSFHSANVSENGNIGSAKPIKSIKP
jgi:hypothetical protein